jgi:hypothetical protein
VIVLGMGDSARGGGKRSWSYGVMELSASVFIAHSHCNSGILYRHQKHHELGLDCGETPPCNAPYNCVVNNLSYAGGLYTV